jgi:hypothetical protein
LRNLAESYVYFLLLFGNFEIHEASDRNQVTVNVADLFSLSHLSRRPIDGLIGVLVGQDAAAPFKEPDQTLAQCLVLFSSPLPVFVQA